MPEKAGLSSEAQTSAGKCQRSSSVAGTSGTLFNYQNAQKSLNGYRFRLTDFWEVGTNSVIVCGRVVHNYVIKNKLGGRTHVDYCLVSEWGLPEHEDEIRMRASNKAEEIVANLSKRDNVTYRLAGVEKLTRAKYNVLKEYINHYVDESLQTYDTSDEQTTEEE